MQDDLNFPNGKKPFCHTRTILKFQLSLNCCKSQLAKWPSKTKPYFGNPSNEDEEKQAQ